MLEPLETATSRYPFTVREFERLAAYRAAIAAGFYTDEPAAATRSQLRFRESPLSLTNTAADCAEHRYR